MFNYYTYSPWRAKRNGKKDGKLNASSKHYEESLVHCAEHQANRIAKRWNKKDKKLKAKYCNALSRRDVGKNNLDLANEELKKPKGDFEDEQEKYKSTYATHYLGALGYILTLIAVGVVDFLLNLTSLYSLGASQVFTISFSLVVSFIGIPILVHVLGIKLARSPFENGKGNTSEKVGIGLIVFMLFGVIIVMTILRMGYFTSVQKQFSISGITLETSPVMTALVLGGLAILFVLLGVMIGHGRYEPEALERRKALSVARQRFGLAQDGITRAERIYQKMLEKFYTAEANRKNEFTLMRNNVENINKIIQVLSKHYRMHYERSAKKKRPTESVHFDSLPISEMPEGLRLLDEHCAV